MEKLKLCPEEKTAQYLAQIYHRKPTNYLQVIPN
jgi:hypothetical protein